MRYRLIFILAAIYSIAFGTWLFISPDGLFGLLGMPPPLPGVYSKPLSMIIIVFSTLYFYAAILPSNAKKPIILGLISKIVPSVLLLYLVLAEGWSYKLFYMVFINDMIWWIPFYRFITRKKKVKTNLYSPIYEQQKN